MNRVQRERFRELLLARRRDLSAELGHLREQALAGPAPGGAAAATGYDSHLVDTASELWDRSEALSFAAHLDGELARVESALERLASGRFGLCARCGEAIPLERLQALPEAAHCVRCSAELGRPAADGRARGGGRHPAAWLRDDPWAAPPVSGRSGPAPQRQGVDGVALALAGSRSGRQPR